MSIAAPLSHPVSDVKGRIDYLDGWRGLAILLVLVGHFFQVNHIYLAVLGVDLFFVLSGRLMGEILFVQNTPLPKFFTRRFTRVYPGLFVFVLLAAALFYFTSLRVGPLAVLSALTFTLNYAVIYFHPMGIFDHLWSLCVEEHAYVILGVIAYLHRSRGIRAPEVIFAIGILAIINGLIQTLYFGRGYFEVFWRTDVQLAPIFIAAALFMFLRERDLKHFQWLCPACLVVAVLCKSNIAGASIANSLGTLFLALSMASLHDAPALFKQMLSFAPLRQLGIWSYSLYLWQQPFFKLMGSAPTLLLLAAAFAFGLASYYFVERPARTYLNKKIGGGYSRQARTAAMP